MDEKESKEKQEYEESLQRRLKILKQKMEEGKIRLPNDPHIKESLLAVRYGPDGKVDLKTVNGCVRSLSLAVTFWHDREETKKAMPLKQIQEIYFQFIENNFGQYFDIMRKKKLTPHDVGVALTKNPSTIDSMSKTIPEFMESIDEFWKIAEKAAYAHIEDVFLVETYFHPTTKTLLRSAGYIQIPLFCLIPLCDKSCLWAGGALKTRYIIFLNMP